MASRTFRINANSLTLTLQIDVHFPPSPNNGENRQTIETTDFKTLDVRAQRTAIPMGHKGQRGCGGLQATAQGRQTQQLGLSRESLARVTAASADGQKPLQGPAEPQGAQACEETAQTRERAPKTAGGTATLTQPGAAGSPAVPGHRSGLRRAAPASRGLLRPPQHAAQQDTESQCFLLPPSLGSVGSARPLPDWGRSRKVGPGMRRKITGDQPKGSTDDRLN